MKKILAIIFIVLLNISIINAEEYDQETIDMNLEQAEKAAEIEDTLKENGYPEYYGGIYISDDSTHVVMLIVEENLPKDINSKEYELLENIIRKHEDIEIKYVKNSYKELLETFDKISNYSKENREVKKITSHSIDVINNKVTVSIKNLELNEIKNVKDHVTNLKNEEIDDIIVFEKSGRNGIDSLDAGQGLTIGKYEDNCSMGYRVKINNKPGYITAAHCFEKNGVGAPGGTVKIWQKGGPIDAAFVEVATSLMTFFEPTNNLKYTSGTITKLNTSTCPTLVVNQIIAKVGVKTGYTTGKIRELNKSVTFLIESGYSVDNIIRTEYTASGGDSGGVVFIPKNVNGGATVVGIHIGFEKDYKIVVPASEIYKVFNYTRY